MGLLPEKRCFIVSLVLSTLFVIVFVSLRINNLKVFPFTYGYEPLFPTFLFGVIGFSMGLGKKLTAGRTDFFSVTLSAGVFAIMTFFYGIQKLLISGGCYFVSYSFKYGNLVQNLFSRNVAGKYNVSIWNFDTGCFFYVLAIVVLIRRIC